MQYYKLYDILSAMPVVAERGRTKPEQKTGISSARRAVVEAKRNAVFGSASVDAVMHGPESIRMDSIQYIATWLSQHDGLPYLILRHDKMSVAEKAGMFKTIESRFGNLEYIRPIRTVTLEIGEETIAVTNLGEAIDKRLIADHQKIGYKAVKGATINPDTIDVVDTFGSESGTIGPFILPENINKIAAWYYIVDPTIPPETPVHLALSHTHSLILEHQNFEQLLTDFEKDTLTNQQRPQFFTRIEASAAQA